MEKIIFLSTLLLSIFNYSAFAQNTLPPTGNVGINTANPTVSLEVNGITRTRELRLSNPTNYDLKIKHEDNIGTSNTTFYATRYAQNYLFKKNSPTGEKFQFYMGTSLGDNHRFDVYNSDNDVKIRLNTGGDSFILGNLGIGTPISLARLHVATNENALSWGLIVNNNRNSPDISNYGIGIKLKHGNNQEGYKWGGIASIQEDAWANHSGLALYANETEHMRIRSNGYVGIGTTDPQNKLDINGTARAKEIRVESSWGDYVFLSDYQLPTLAQEAKHIEEKGHLFGFQSAEQMNGEIQLGDVTKRQQVKIEEMMLHIIQMNERLEQLEQENAQLKARKRR